MANKLAKYKDELLNKKRILHLIQRESELSRGELVELSGLSLMSVTKFAASLITDGIVLESDGKIITGGRKAKTLKLNPEFTYFICIDIGAYSTKIGLVMLNGELKWKKEIKADINTMPTMGITLDGLIQEIDSIINEYGSDMISAICIGVSGLVNYDRGRIIFCPNIHGFNDVPIVDILTERFDIPTYVDTSARCMALAEQHHGISKAYKTQTFITISYSIGAGIIVDSKLFRGANGYAGELGHIKVKSGGETCSCGNTGCLELYATLPLIIKNIKKSLKDYTGYSPLLIKQPDISKIDIDMIVDALKDGDKIVRGIVVNTGKMIGNALSNMINIINPSCIILGGSVVDNFPMIVDEVERTIKSKSLSPIYSDLTIKQSTLGRDSSITGCSLLAIKDFLE